MFRGAFFRLASYEGGYGAPQLAQAQWVRGYERRYGGVGSAGVLPASDAVRGTCQVRVFAEWLRNGSAQVIDQARLRRNGSWNGEP